MSNVKYSIEELKDRGLAIAKFNKTSNLFATADGQFFLHENAAAFHASKNGLVVHKLEYSEVSEPDREDAKPVKKSVDERIESIRNTGVIAEIVNLLKGEGSKQVKEAAAARIEEIKAAQNADTRQ